ncbi:MAG: hypothetical protein IJK78_09815 [Bacteroidales bacterium]|nr:hypothetical protein [Bacteroidales bacterium]
MKAKSLQFEKALSAALFVLLLSVVGMKNALAQNQVATLQHNDTITGVFYGQNAFSSAYNAAADGDVITLSSGTFDGINISKSISIRGAGCVLDTVINVLPTIISSDIGLRTNNITFEGICFNGTIGISNNWCSFSYFKFVKCNINGIINGGGYTQMSCQFNNCIISNYNLYRHHCTSITNSVVRFTSYFHNDIYNPTNIYNSVIVFDDGLPINNIVAYNSIISTVSGHNVSNNTFFNCINIKTGETSLFEDQLNTSNMEVNNYSDVFETFDGTISYDNIYQLKNDVATSFLGHDGTEVGIYGGITPYKTRPSYMILKNCNVAGQTDENKKLNVEMELIGPED